MIKKQRGMCEWFVVSKGYVDLKPFFFAIILSEHKDSPYHCHFASSLSAMMMMIR